MKKKQLFAVLLAGSMTVGMAPAAAFAAEDTGAAAAEAQAAEENTGAADGTEFDAQTNVDGADSQQEDTDGQADAQTDTDAAAAQAAADAEAQAAAEAQAQAEAEAQAQAEAAQQQLEQEQAAAAAETAEQGTVVKSEEELQKVAELDKVITEAEKDALIDTIIVKTQGFVNGNIKEGDKNPVSIFKRLLALYKDINRDALRENMRYFLSAIMPVCEEYGVNMCVHPDDPPFQVLGLPRIVTNENDIEWFLNAVDNPHNGLTFCAGSLSAGEHNDTRELAKKFAKRTHFVHLRSTAAMQGGNFIESSHLTGRGHLVDLIRIFENENPGLPMRVDHGRMMLGDEDKGYNPGYSFYGRMLALAQVEGMMTVVDDEIKRQMKL